MVERMIRSTSSASKVHGVVDDNSNPYRTIVMDVMRMNQGHVDQFPIIDEEPNADTAKFFIFWKILTNHYELSDASYDKIIERTISILPEGNKLKENFYIAKFMMKPFGLGYQKIDMYPNFCMMYYLENVELTECRTCDILITNSKVVGKWLLSHIKNLDTSQSHLNYRGYSYHQRLLSTWHDTNHMIWWIE